MRNSQDVLRHHESLISILGLVVVLAVARGMDAILESLRQRNEVTVDLAFTILWSQTLIAILLAAVLLLLAWFVLLRAPRNLWIAGLYLVVGALLAVAPQLYFTPALAAWIPALVFLSIALPGSYQFIAGGFIFVIGLLSLILPRRGLTAVKSE